MITVGKLLWALREYDEDTPVLVANCDHGYVFANSPFHLEVVALNNGSFEESDKHPYSSATHLKVIIIAGGEA